MIQHAARFIGNGVRHGEHSGPLLTQATHDVVKFSSKFKTLAPDNTGRLHVGDKDLVPLSNLQAEVLKLW